MPPRYAYWTILVDDQPTAFRAGAKEDLLPTFNRLKEKQPSAKMMWFQNGKLWDSRLDAQEAMRARGEIGRRNDDRQGGFRDRPRSSDRPRRNGGEHFSAPKATREDRDPSGKLDWKPKGEGAPREERKPRADWKPKPFGARPEPDWKAKPEWRPKSAGAPRRSSSASEGGSDWKPKAAWKPKSAGDRPRRSSSASEGGSDWKPKAAWKPKSAGDRPRRSSSASEGGSDWKPKAAWKPKSAGDRPRRSSSASEGGPSRSEKLEWKPKGEARGGSSGPRTQDPRPKTPEKRKWVPKEEYKRSMGIEAKKDKNWRPGGDHKDPRQKYKDAKKAKWSRFKQNIRAKAQGKKKDR